MMLKRKDGNRRYFQYLEIEGNMCRWFDREEQRPWEPLEEYPQNEYEEVDLTYEEAMLIDNL